MHDAKVKGSGPDGAREARTARSVTVVLGVLSFTGIVVALQQTLVLPLLPDFPRLLDTSADSASWLMTSTLLAGAIAIPTISRLADMVGKKRMMLVALAVSLVGSLLGALTHDLVFAILARGLQGVGIAMIPVGIAIMRDELPAERVPLGVALMSATLAIGAGAALPLGGLLATRFDWHASFWVTAAAGLLALIAVRVVMSESPVKTHGSFDFGGAILLSGSLTAILLVLSKGNHWGWSSTPTLLCTGLGVTLGAIWVPLELRVRNPLVDLRLAAQGSVPLVNTVSVLTGFGVFTNMLVSSQVLQSPTSAGGMGLDVLHTGLWMIPSVLMFGLMAPVAAVAIRRIGGVVTLLLGATGMGVVYVGRALFTDHLWQIVAGSMLVCVGTSLAYAAMPNLLMHAVPVTESASANGLNSLLRSIGTAIASATMAAVISFSVSKDPDQIAPGMSAVAPMYWIAALLCGIAALFVLPLFRMPEDQRRREETPAHSAVARGSVLTPDRRPVRNAVVTLLTTTGDEVDWGRTDAAGKFNVAVPGSGDYIAVTSVEGWSPSAQPIEVDDNGDIPPLCVTERLLLSGKVQCPSGVPAQGVSLVLSRQSGETVARTQTSHLGRYEFPLPANGRYVLTAISHTTTACHGFTIWDTPRTIDLALSRVAGQE